jgi:hypothetical protein
MSQQLQISTRVSELKAEIAAIANCPKANNEAAAKAAGALIACYPSQRAQDPQAEKVYQRQLIELLIGADMDVVAAMLNPKNGLVSRLKWLPTIAEVSGFIEEKMDPKRSRIGWYMDEIAVLERDAEPDVPEEERRRNLQMLKDVSQLIKDTAAATRRASPPLPAWHATEEEAQKGRLEALAYNDAMRGSK